MKTFKLKNGSDIPALGLGTWQLQGADVRRAVEIAYKIGYRYIDTAEAYGNENEIGETLKTIKAKREELFITSKIFRGHLHHDDVIAGCKNTLKALQTDYLDLYLIHWPDKNVPLAETLGALNELKEQGLIKAIGVSNFTVHHLEDAKKINVEITNNQVEFHPSLYQNELLEYCNREKILLTAYSPIGQGRDLKFEIVKKLAAKYERTPSQVVLNWIISKGANVIPRSSDPEHIEDNFKALEWDLAPEDAAQLDNLNENYRIVQPHWQEFDY